MKTTKTYFLTFSKDVRTTEMAYGIYPTVHHKGDVIEVDEGVYDALFKGYPVVGFAVLGHGVVDVRYEYTLEHVSKIIEKKVTEELVYNKA